MAIHGHREEKVAQYPQSKNKLAQYSQSKNKMAQYSPLKNKMAQYRLDQMMIKKTQTILKLEFLQLVALAPHVFVP